MPSTSNSVASSGFDVMTRSRSSRILFTHAIVFFALLAGSTTKTWSYLFLKYRASFARNPASAGATGDDSSPTVETSLKSTVYDMARAFHARRGPTIRRARVAGHADDRDRLPRRGRRRDGHGLHRRPDRPRRCRRRPRRPPPRPERPLERRVPLRPAPPGFALLRRSVDRARNGAHP